MLSEFNMTSMLYYFYDSLFVHFMANYRISERPFWTTIVQNDLYIAMILIQIF